MAENIGKRAQEVREQRLREQEEAIRRKIDRLTYCSKNIEENISFANDMLNKGKLKKKDKYDDKIRAAKCRDEIKESISSIESIIVELQALDEQKAATLTPYYQPKIEIWKKELNSISTKIKWIRIIRFVIIFGFIAWLVIDDIIEHGI